VADESTQNEPTVSLFRPVGKDELRLIEVSGWREFPPRLPFQPIFYPVTTEEYANKIARDWNTKDPASGFAGYVTRFQVRKAYLDRFETHLAGGQACEEYWIPAEELAEFNRQIVGPIEVIAGFERSPE
jgi:hypothetical protein